MHTRVKEFAADTRDPIGVLVFTALGILSTMGLLPAGLTAADLGQLIGYLMGFVAACYAWWHHRDLKLAIRAGREKQAEIAELSAAPDPVSDVTTPLDMGLSDGAPR